MFVFAMGVVHCAELTVWAEYVQQYASNAQVENDENGEESDGELSEVEDFKSDDEEPAGRMDV